MAANPRNEGIATPDVAGLGLSGRNGAPPSAQATTDRQQPSLDRPHASDYGTNPTGAQSEEQDGGAGPRPFPHPKTSLVDWCRNRRVFRRSAVQIAERTQVPRLLAQSKVAPGLDSLDF